MKRIGQYKHRATFSNFTFTAPTAAGGGCANGDVRLDVQRPAGPRADRRPPRPGRPRLRHLIGATRLSVRGSFDRFTYNGLPDQSGPGLPPLVGDARVAGARWSAVAKANRTLPGRQVLTAGVEVIDTSITTNRSIPGRATLGYRSTVSSIPVCRYVQAS